LKRLVVCCDGTWNRPDEVSQGVAAPTNVAKISLALADQDEAGNQQLLHYVAGVGTRRAERFVGGAFGVGLSRNVQDGYRFLVDNYEPGTSSTSSASVVAPTPLAARSGSFGTPASCGPSTSIG